MARVFSSLALLSGIAAWAFVVMTASNLLSGNFSERECQTACVQGFYYGAVVASVVGLILGVLAIKKSGLDTFNAIAILFPLSVAGIAGFLFFAGNVFI